MAINILQAMSIIHGIHHDLESFYWVLVWVVMRHTMHSLGQEYCSTLFVFGNDQLGASAKIAWIYPVDDEGGERKFYFEVEGNAPLTELLGDFRILVFRARRWPGQQPVLLTYESVLGIFRKAVERTDWPAKDIVPCTLLKKTFDTAVVGAPGDQTAQGAEDEGVNVDVPLEEEADEDEMVETDAEQDDGEDLPDGHDDADPFAGEPGVTVDNEPPASHPVDSDDGTAEPAGDLIPDQQLGMTTRLRAKRNAAGPALEPGPSNSGGSSKRRRTRSPPPLVLRNRGSGSRSRGKPAHQGSASGGSRGRR